MVSFKAYLEQKPYFLDVYQFGELYRLICPSCLGNFLFFSP
jgi:hypothetical protein